MGTAPPDIGTPASDRRRLRMPRTPGDLSQVRLGRLHEAMSRLVERGDLPGLVALVARGGREHLETIGAMAYGGPPMRGDSIFRLASNTKPITAVAAMILVEECRLRLDDAVDEWLPELAHRRVLRTIDSELTDTVPARRSITVRDLLTFRSGYGELMFHSPSCPLQKAWARARLPLSVWPVPGTPDEFMKRLGSLPLAFQPGERWLYHASAEILGVLIARVAGEPLSKFLRRRLFDPLGMKDTGFFVPEADLDRLVTSYKTDPSTGRTTVDDDPRSGVYSAPRLFESGGGGLVSTADDLLAFGRMMLNGGAWRGERILSRSSVEAMTTDRLTAAQKSVSPFFDGFWEARGWGLGLSVVTARDDVSGSPGRYGWEGAFGTSWYVDPREDLVGILLTQRLPVALRLPPVVRDFWTSVYQALDD